MSQMGEHIKANGEVNHVESKGRTFSLEELQGFVGGLIELTRTNDGRDMYVNEEGKLNGLRLNRKATLLYRNGIADPIMGDAIVIGNPRKKRQG